MLSLLRGLLGLLCSLLSLLGGLLGLLLDLLRLLLSLGNCLLSGGLAMRGGLLRLLLRLLKRLLTLLNGLLRLLLSLLCGLLGLDRRLLGLVRRLLHLLLSLLLCSLDSLLGLLFCLIRGLLGLVCRLLGPLHSLLRCLLRLLHGSTPGGLRDGAGKKRAGRCPKLTSTSEKASLLARGSAHPRFETFGGHLGDGDQCAAVPAPNCGGLAPGGLGLGRVGRPVTAGCVGRIGNHAIESGVRRDIRRLRCLEVSCCPCGQVGKTWRGEFNGRQLAAGRRGGFDGAVRLQFRSRLR